MTAKLTGALQLLPTNDYTHHQAATDYQQSAAANIRLHAGGNIEQSSGRQLRIDVEQGKQVTVAGAKASFTVQDGNLTIQAAKDIRITGQGGGDIHFGQGGGGFIIKSDGTVQLYGNKITLKGSSGVNLNGKVNYAVGGGAAMPEAQAAAPLVPRGIALLTDEVEHIEPKMEDIVIKVVDEFDNQLPDHLKLIDGTPYRLVSDSGEVRYGTVVNGEIREPQVMFKESFKLAFGTEAEMEGKA